MADDLKNKTETELLRLVHKTNDQHIMIKDEIMTLLDQIDKLTSEYEQQKVKLEIVEDYYVQLMAEINTRKNVI